MAFLWSLTDYFFWKFFGIPPLNTPWRDTHWDTNRDRAFVRNYRPYSEAQHLRILLHGPTGSGKSSFINSVDSALRRTMAARALAATSQNRSFTNKYKTYKMERYGRFVFCDTMGIERTVGQGAEVEQIKMIMEGRVTDGFTFNTCHPQNDPNYNENPTINDRVHVLVCVVPADTINWMDETRFRKIREIREEASNLGIPQVVVVTKIDKACEVVNYNVRYVYRSSYLKYLMEKLSELVGIPLNCIVPVKNYSLENDTNDDMDTLILNAVKMIINFGEDFLNDQT